MAEIMDAFWHQPVVSSSFVISLLCYCGIVPFGWFHYEPQLLFRMPPQIWRLVTSFLITSPNIGIVMDPYFLFSYLKQIEAGNIRFRRRADVVWYLVCIASFIMIINVALLGHSSGNLRTLIVALAYTCTQDERGIKADFFILTIPAQLVPYAMILMDMVMISPFMIFARLPGILAAHLYDFLSRLWPEFGDGFDLLQTPAFVSRIVDAPSRVPQCSTAATSSSSGSGPLPDAWKTRGKGQRLGD